MINFMVIIGLYRIMSLDPGFVTHPSTCHDLFVRIPKSKVEGQGEVFTRYRKTVYCKHCKHYVLGFDHHCPAFGNCIGQRNHVLFIVLLVGVVVSEAAFAACASQCQVISRSLDKTIKC